MINLRLVRYEITQNGWRNVCRECVYIKNIYFFTQTFLVLQNTIPWNWNKIKINKQNKKKCSKNFCFSLFPNVFMWM